MKIAIASDHAGRNLRASIRARLEQFGHQVLDLGTEKSEAVDYPDFAAQVGSRVARGDAERGILVCGSGLGMAIAANKIPGVRAVAPYDARTAELSRAHNDANVVCFGERTLDHDRVFEILDVWMRTRFDGGRHVPRIEKIRRIEESSRRARPPAAGG